MSSFVIKDVSGESVATVKLHHGMIEEYKGMTLDKKIEFMRKLIKVSGHLGCMIEEMTPPYMITGLPNRVSPTTIEWPENFNDYMKAKTNF